MSRPDWAGEEQRQRDLADAPIRTAEAQHRNAKAQEATASALSRLADAAETIGVALSAIAADMKARTDREARGWQP